MPTIFLLYHARLARPPSVRTAAIFLWKSERKAMSLLIASAHAAPAAAAPAGPSVMGQLLMFLPIIAIFYFLIWRPQMRRNKEHRAMIEALAVGSEVIFAGGLMGQVKKLEGEYAVVAMGNNDVVVQKAAVISVLPAGTLAQLTQSPAVSLTK